MSDLVDYLRDKLEQANAPADEVVCICPHGTVSRQCAIHGQDGTGDIWMTTENIRAPWRWRR